MPAPTSDRSIRVSTPATLEEKELIYVKLMMDRYRTEKVHGRLLLSFEAGRLKHINEERSHLIPPPPPPPENGK